MKKIFTLLLMTLFAMSSTLGLASTFYANPNKLKVSPLTFDDGASVSVTGKTCDPGSSITINGKQYVSFKISAGYEYTFTAPAGDKVKKMTIYAYENNSPVAGGYFEYIGTQEFGSSRTLTADKNSLTKPDVFEAEFDEPQSLVNFKCMVKQLCVVLEVEYAVITGELLKAPVITYDKTSGEVTITAENGASKICYTTDGSTPTAKSTEYTAPIKVEDGTVIKALAVGDDVNYRSSDVATETMYLSSGQIAPITCDDFNGAFHLLCETPNVKIEYQIGVDPDWLTYKLPVTLFEEGTTVVKARATRDGWTTSTASFDIVVPPYVKGHDEIIVGFGSFTEGSASKTLTGVIGDDTKAMGITLSMDDAEFSYGNVDLTLNGYGTETRKSIKGSNGKEITMTIPKGMTVMRIAFFNYIATDVTPEDAYWAVKYGETGTDEDWVTSEIVPDESHDKTDPAARVFKFEGGVKDQLVFKHNGIQPVFCMVVYVVYDDMEITHDQEETEGLWVEHDEISVTLKPAQPHHEIWAKFEPYKASRSVDASTLGTEFTKLETINDEGHVEVVVPAKTPGTLSYYSLDPTTLKQSDVKTMTFDDSTGIEDVLVDGVDQAAEYYNLQGQRVLNPVKGNLYIVKKAGKATKVVL
ncbi:MAG: hypothetical protein HDR97_06955 [Bacteroides sp.]|nr:hypothetical protein [Bacteroides sp.]